MKSNKTLELRHLYCSGCSLYFFRWLLVSSKDISREDVEAIAEGLEECIEDVDEEQFELLAKLLGALYSEFSALSKKQPDAWI